MVTLSCNATGKPAPNINWTRVADDGTDSAPLLPVVDGKHVINNTMRSSNGTYRCTADNGVGNPVNRTVRVTVRYSASIVRIVNSSYEGDSFSMTCEATGDPKPNVHWIKVDGQRIDDKVLNFTNINRSDAGQYRCEAENDCGSDSRVQSIEVYYKPGDVSLNPNISNSTVCVEFIVHFTCTADANPPVNNYTLYENGTVVNTRRSGVWMISINTAGRIVYSCEANNSQGSEKSSDTTLNVEVPASVTSVDSKVVNESNDVTLFCNVSGVPSPNVSWINDKNEEVHVGAMWALTNITRKYKGEYKCIASNTCGKDNKTAVINVKYAPSVDPKDEKIKVTKGDPASYICPVDGNPPPNVTWYEGNGISSNVHSSGNELKIGNLQSNKSYTCKARNSLGTAIGSVHFVVVEKSTRPKETVTIIKITLTITNKDCNNKNLEVETFRILILKLYERDGIKEVIMIDIRCGSIILDYELHFTKSVSESEVITTLKDAAKQDRFGDFKVDPDSIKPTAKKSPCKDSLFKDAECDLKVIPVVILVVCGVVVIAFVVGGGAIYYWVHKRKKCRKDPRIRNSDDQEALSGNQSAADKNAYSQVNGAFAHSGLSSANGTDAAAQQPREGANGTDATVEQQQEQQKAKPGETLYADLGEFQPRQMPAVSTSPDPLPPIKRPPAYEETQYADITQYLKGDATLPDTNNSQGTEMTYANVEGGKEKPKDTAKEGGNEEKPKETSKEGGNEEKRTETANEGGNEGKRKETRM